MRAAAERTLGTDGRGRALLVTGDRIAAAVEVYQTASGAYPAKLEDLPEKFDLSGGTFSYFVNNGEYSLSVTYRPPWPNSRKTALCSYRRVEKSWTCGTIRFVTRLPNKPLQPTSGGEVEVE